MGPAPIYSAEHVQPAFCLRYSWIGWLREPLSAPALYTPVLESLRERWETDGLRLLEWRVRQDKFQITFSTTPLVSPVLLASRCKGRLQDALRKASFPHRFRRKRSVRSIGNNTTAQVESYIKNQVKKAAFVNADFQSKMRELTFVDPFVELSRPTASGHGIYWYNLHLVLVTRERYRIADWRLLRTIHDGCLKIARKKRYGISTLSVMLEHLHVAFRGDPRQSPQEIALAFQNNLAYLAGEDLWMESFYVGTFSEYSMRAVRRDGL